MQKESVRIGKKRELSAAKAEDENVAAEIKKPEENTNLLVALLQPEKQDNYLPRQFKKKRKKQSKGWSL